MLTLDTFKQYWDKQFPDARLRRSHFVLAVSGGVDSIVLAHLMHTVKANCTIAHVNFQLRDAESERDEQFVRNYAAQLNMPIQVHTCETAKYAETYKMGIQQAAREIRYAWFGALMQSLASDKPVILLTAHHADDQVETILMQLFRGTGIHGLTGIPVRRMDSLNIARPLLAFSKASIKEYAAVHNLRYVEDSSNEKNDYTRNLIRNQLLPQIETVFPKVSENIIATSERLKEAEQIVVNTVTQFWKKGFCIKKGIPSIPIKYWNKVKGNATYTWDLIKDYGFKPQQIEEIYKILEANQGAFIASSTHRLIKWEDHIQFVPNSTVKEFITIEPDFNGSSIITAHGNMHFQQIENNVNLIIDKDAKYAYLDADKITGPLLYRTWESTDYFYPLGLAKKKKLNHFLGSLKMSPSVKLKQAVLTLGDKIIWVVGQRIDDRFKVKPSTKNIIRIEYNELHKF